MIDLYEIIPFAVLGTLALGAMVFGSVPRGQRGKQLVNVTFRNPKTGELKQVKVGWSWILFLFSGLFGLPLFLRRLQMWGWLFFALWAVNLLAASRAPGIFITMQFIILGLRAYP